MTHSPFDAAPERDLNPLDASERASAPFDLAQLIAQRSEPERADVADSLLWTIEPRILPADRPAPARRSGAPLAGWLAVSMSLALTVCGALAFAQHRAPVALTLTPSAQPTASAQPTRLPDVWHAPKASAATTTATREASPADTPATTRARRAPARVAARTVVAAPSHSWEAGGAAPAPIDRDLDSLLDAALGDVSADPAHTGERVVLPETPTRRQVSTTLRALEGEVARCGDGRATVRLAVEGATGRVTRATASGVDASTAACVEDAVESARFPHFERDSFSITFPYTL